MYYLEDIQHYPTPHKLALKMFNKLSKGSYKNVLEPSAGKGDLADSFNEWAINRQLNGFKIGTKPNIDVIEIDFNLMSLLIGKNYNIIGNDFLDFDTKYKYDLIIMNPPFKDGDRHLLKAMDIMESGGEILCLLNAETIRNPYSITRQALSDKLKELNAEVEFIENAFIDSERKTDVEIAMIYIDIPKKEYDSSIFDTLKKGIIDENISEITDIASNKKDIDMIIKYYNLEVETTLTLLNEFHKLSSIGLIEDPMLSNFNIRLNGLDIDNSNRDINKVIENIRLKYWKHLFNTGEVFKRLTSTEMDNIRSDINKFAEYEFNKFNIMQLQHKLIEGLSESIEDSIMELFDWLSQEYSMTEFSNNIHYFNGWKTNKSWFVNEKVIVPIYSMDQWGSNWRLTYSFREKLLDVFKALAYLEGNRFDSLELNNLFDIIQNKQQTKKIDTRYFTINLYRKGTMHLKFKDKELLKRFNRYGANKRAWLPPSYGKKSYKDMSEEEKTIIDSFEGKDVYTKDLVNNKIQLQDIILQLE